MQQYVKLHDLLKGFVASPPFVHHDNVLKIASFLLNSLQFDFMKAMLPVLKMIATSGGTS
jgi:hypothetical protein